MHTIIGKIRSGRPNQKSRDAEPIRALFFRLRIPFHSTLLSLLTPLHPLTISSFWTFLQDLAKCSLERPSPPGYVYFFFYFSFTPSLLHEWEGKTPVASQDLC